MTMPPCRASRRVEPRRRRRSTARLPGPVPDPGRDELPDQQLARRGAGGGLGQPAGVLRDLGLAGRPGLGGDLVDAGRRPRRPRRPADRRGAGEVVFQPNVTLAHAVVFSRFDFRRGRPRIVTDAMHFPSILYLIERAAGPRAPRSRSCPSDDGIGGRHAAADRGDRRADGVRQHLARAVQVGLCPRRRGDRGAGAAGRRRHGHRRLSVRRHDPRGRAGAGGGRLHRRLPEVALRRARGRRSSGSIPGSAARLGPRLTGWMSHAAAVRLRADAGPPRRRLAVPPRHAEHPGPVRGPAGTGDHRPHRASRPSAQKSLRQTARLLELADARGYPLHDAPRPRPARRDRRHRRRARLRDLAGPQSPGHPLRLPPRRRHPALAPLLHPRRRARRRRRRNPGDPADGRLAGVLGAAGDGDLRTREFAMQDCVPRSSVELVAIHFQLIDSPFFTPIEWLASAPSNARRRSPRDRRSLEVSPRLAVAIAVDRPSVGVLHHPSRARGHGDRPGMTGETLSGPKGQASRCGMRPE